MKNSFEYFIVVFFVFVDISMSAAGAKAAEGSEGGSSCMVTVHTTNEDGTIDHSVRPFQAPCREGQSNGDYEYYNPYSNSHVNSGLPPITPLKAKSRAKGSSSSRTSTSSTSGSSRDGAQTSRTTSPNAPKTNKPIASTPR